MKITTLKEHSAFYWKRLRFIIQLVGILASVVFFALWFKSNLVAIQSVWRDMKWSYVAISFTLLVISFLFLPTAVFVFMRHYGRTRFSYLQSARAYYGAQLTKYLPGGLWVYPARLMIMRRMGADLSVSTLAILFETIALVTSSLLVSLITLNVTVARVWSVGIQTLVAVTCLCIAAALLMLPELFHWITKRGRWLQSLERIRTAIPLLLRLKLLVISVVIYSVMWIVTGLSFYVLLAAMPESLAVKFVFVSIGTFTLAWLIGFISVITPTGIGVREGIIIAILGAFLSSPYPMLAAVFSRVFWSAADFSFFVFSLLVHRSDNSCPQE